MRNLSLRQYHLVVKNLLERRRAQIAVLSTAGTHITALESLHERLSRAVDQLDAGMQDPVRIMTAEHIAQTRRLQRALTSYANNPFNDEPVREAAARLRKVVDRRRVAHKDGRGWRFILVESIARMRPNLAPYLALLPAVVTEQLDAWIVLGQALTVGLSERTEGEASEYLRRDELVWESRRTLARLRRSIRNEVELHPEVGDLETAILGFPEDMAPPQPRPEAAPDNVAPADAESSGVPPAPEDADAVVG